jgi:hypothetical protein
MNCSINEEVGMNGTKHIWAFLVMFLFLGSAEGARAANYTLTCEPAKGDSFTIVLTGFNFKVTGGAESASGMAAGRTAGKFELSIRFALSKDYEALLSMAEDNEVMRSCKLTDSDVSAGPPTSENVAKGKNAKMKSQTSTSSGAPEWILSNATITSISAIGSENNAGVPESSVQAIIEAQKYTFTM